MAGAGGSGVWMRCGRAVVHRAQTRAGACASHPRVTVTATLQLLWHVHGEGGAGMPPDNAARRASLRQSAPHEGACGLARAGPRPRPRVLGWLPRAWAAARATFVDPPAAPAAAAVCAALRAATGSPARRTASSRAAAPAFAMRSPAVSPALSAFASQA
eukprot:scaffold12592_cov120-Isochrysis_galbana.AAC.5